jgi:3-deoxy-D-manno-octulosonate 8-phosphate phosphatase (KDO 8-P phosphatase)
MIHPSSIRLLVTDLDGVWTDGSIIYSSDGTETKEFHVRDGLGVKLAQRAGIEVAVVTSRQSEIVERRCRELGIETVVQRAEKKIDVVRQLAEERDLEISQVAYIGDDLPDLASMKYVGISAAPSDAAPEILAVATWKLDARGGRGAVREFVERLLFERNEWSPMVDQFLT